MRLLLIHRYFWPDTPPYASMLRYLGSSWSADGHSVSVFTAQPSYKSELNNDKRAAREQVDGIDIVRCRLLEANGPLVSLVNTALFIAQLMWFIVRQPKFDVIVMSTVPQVLGAWCASLVASLKKSRFIYHMQDIHPEGAVYGGVIKSAFIVRVLKAFDTQTCRRSAAVVVLSKDMKTTLLERDSQLDGKINIVKNPPMNDYTCANTGPVNEEHSCGILEESESSFFRVVFAGNLGRFQGLETIVAAGVLLKNSKKIKIIFVGDGKARAALERQAKDAGSVIEFTGHKTITEADQLIASADLALISLSPNIYRVAFPSKILSYAKLGTPILAVIEPHSELASLVEEWDMGYCVDVGDAEGLAKQIDSASNAPDKIETQSANVMKFGTTTFNVADIKNRWRDLLASNG